MKAVLFDLDDTLHDDTSTYRRATESVANEVASECGISATALADAYVAEADRFWQGLSAKTFEQPLVALRVSMWRAALGAVGIDDLAVADRCAADYNRYRRDYLELWPGALELLARLRARGLKLAMITNGMSETHRDKIAILRLEDAFDEIFIADEVGMIKPDVRLFELAAVRLGVAPSACVMVGDRLERDVLGARDAGMFTIWMNVRGETVPARGPHPDAIVRSVDEVEAALPRAQPVP
jgi:putative hydrolase of the HAD superfamily